MGSRSTRDWDTVEVRKRCPATRALSEIKLRHPSQPKPRPNSLITLSEKSSNEVPEAETFWIPGSLARHMGYEVDDGLPDMYSAMPRKEGTERGLVEEVMDLYDHPRALLNNARQQTPDTHIPPPTAAAGDHNLLHKERNISQAPVEHRISLNGDKSAPAGVADPVQNNSTARIPAALSIPLPPELYNDDQTSIQGHLDGSKVDQDEDDDGVELESLSSDIESSEETQSIYAVDPDGQQRDDNLVLMHKITVTSRRSLDYHDEASAPGTTTESSATRPAHSQYSASSSPVAKSSRVLTIFQQSGTPASPLKQVGSPPGILSALTKDDVEGPVFGHAAKELKSSSSVVNMDGSEVKTPTTDEQIGLGDNNKSKSWDQSAEVKMTPVGEAAAVSKSSSPGVSRIPRLKQVTVSSGASNLSPSPAASPNKDPNTASPGSKQVCFSPGAGQSSQACSVPAFSPFETAHLKGLPGSPSPTTGSPHSAFSSPNTVPTSPKDLVDLSNPSLHPALCRSTRPADPSPNWPESPVHSPSPAMSQPPTLRCGQEACLRVEEDEQKRSSVHMFVDDVEENNNPLEEVTRI